MILAARVFRKRANHSSASSRENTSSIESIGDECVTFLNPANALPATRCVGESLVIRSGNCCSILYSSCLSESSTASEIESASSTCISYRYFAICSRSLATRSFASCLVMSGPSLRDPHRPRKPSGNHPAEPNSPEGTEGKERREGHAIPSFPHADGEQYKRD